MTGVKMFSSLFDSDGVARTLADANAFTVTPSDTLDIVRVELVVQNLNLKNPSDVELHISKPANNSNYRIPGPPLTVAAGALTRLVFNIEFGVCISAGEAVTFTLREDGDQPGHVSSVVILSSDQFYPVVVFVDDVTVSPRVDLS